MRDFALWSCLAPWDLRNAFGLATQVSSENAVSRAAVGFWLVCPGVDVFIERGTRGSDPDPVPSQSHVHLSRMDRQTIVFVVVCSFSWFLVGVCSFLCVVLLFFNCFCIVL